jgi:GT2 family glycosyltransferase
MSLTYQSSPKNIQLSIVYLNFNRLHETQYTSEQLLRICANRADIEIIAVDNGSNDGSAEYLAKAEGIDAILLKDNSGIQGYNIAFKQAKGRYLLVLDDDSCPKDLASINKMLQLMDDNPQLGLLACHIETPEGRYQWSWHLPNANRNYDSQLIDSPFFIGCGFIIKNSLLAQIKGYPGHFFLYQNEIDVAFQVKQQGYQIAYHSDCKVIHRGIPNQRPGWRRVFYPTRNTLWLIRRYYPWPQASYMIFSRIIIGLIRAVQFNQVSNWFKAIKEAFKTPVRKTILSQKIRSESNVFFVQNSVLHRLILFFSKH